ncbi:Rha family transcriptional regulator [Pseudodonghicola flavimaris]|uniref:Phage regulatory protein/antirepressor Ant n=1 Tax=Pseudodonghicola flavimaris TaxID=3050036 RepID=A0ABT7F8K7_9RHOB|nr:phage regulatory protein/antirepressor Ant [Pseudodonghicola flavimaris]MDK3020959.1 phage regulatory protein/antirepressor Ant [Pseudodonghicola flavimaris]
MNMPVKHGDFNGIEIMERDGALLASSREVAKNFGKQHKNVLQAIRNLECSDEFNGLNFQPVEYMDAKGEKRTEYGMTRDGFSFLVMGFTGREAAHWKEQYISAFNAMEQKLRAPMIDVRDQSQLTQIAIQLIEVNQDQAKQIEAMREDVEAHERLTKADGSLNVTEAAKTLGVRPKDLFDWLSHNGWLYKRTGSPNWLGYQSKCNSGLLEHKTTTVLRADGSEKITEQVRVTPKGCNRPIETAGYF